MNKLTWQILFELGQDQAMKKIFQILGVITLMVSIQACAIISYDTIPESAWDQKSPSQTLPMKLTYSLQEFNGLTFGGQETLRTIMAHSGAFFEIERVYENPGKGFYVDIETRNKQPNLGGFVWGYIALSTLFILPAYSGSTGFEVIFHIYKNGKLIRHYQYDIDRKGFAWLPLLPFVWINLITDSEEDAFRAVTRQWIADTARDGIFGAKTVAN